MIADPKANEVSEIKLLTEYQQSLRNRAKAQINNKFLLTLFLERKFNSQLTGALGVQVPLQKKSATGEKKHAANKAGVKLAWNL